MSKNINFKVLEELIYNVYLVKNKIYFFLHLCFSVFTASMRPNIFLGVSEGSAQYKKWYYELVIDQVDHFVTSEPSHLRVGWANTKGYAPYPGGGEGWGGNGVGDDLYSFGFDGLHLWSGQWAGKRVDFIFFFKEIVEGQNI